MKIQKSNIIMLILFELIYCIPGIIIWKLEAEVYFAEIFFYFIIYNLVYFITLLGFNFVDKINKERKYRLRIIFLIVSILMSVLFLRNIVFSYRNFFHAIVPLSMALASITGIVEVKLERKKGEV